MVRLLAGERRNLTVVGDDDQSIYRFRGAKMANLLAFLDTFPEAATVVLTTNYRSRQNLLDSAYRLIQHNNPDRLEAQFTIEPFEPRLRRYPHAMAGPRIRRCRDDFPHQLAAQSHATRWPRREHTAHRRLGVLHARIQQAGIGERHPMRLGPGGQVEGRFVMAVDIEIETLLLDDEYLLARGIDVLQLNDGQRIETATLPK